MKICVGADTAKRGVVPMTTVGQEVARVTILGRDAPECHLSKKISPEITISESHTHPPMLYSKRVLVSMFVCVCGYRLQEQL